MLGLGVGEFVVLAVVVIIAVGPKAMPDFFRTLGRGLRQFRKATRELRAQTGIDDLLREPSVRRQHPPKKAREPVELTASDRRREFPLEGVDIFHARSMGDDGEAASPSGTATPGLDSVPGPAPAGGDRGEGA